MIFRPSQKPLAVSAYIHALDIKSPWQLYALLGWLAPLLLLAVILISEFCTTFHSRLVILISSVKPEDWGHSVPSTSRMRTRATSSFSRPETRVRSMAGADAQTCNMGIQRCRIQTVHPIQSSYLPLLVLLRCCTGRLWHPVHQISTCPGVQRTSRTTLLEHLQWCLGWHEVKGWEDFHMTFLSCHTMNNSTPTTIDMLYCFCCQMMHFWCNANHYSMLLNIPIHFMHCNSLNFFGQAESHTCITFTM